LPPECKPIQIMRFMKGWSWQNFEDAPAHVNDDIIKMINAYSRKGKYDKQTAEAAARFRGYNF